jgi:hypothetical protein
MSVVAETFCLPSLSSQPDDRSALCLVLYLSLDSAERDRVPQSIQLSSTEALSFFALVFIFLLTTISDWY